MSSMGMTADVRGRKATLRLFLFVCFLVVATLASGADAPAVEMVVLESAPILDGNVTDEEWGAASVVDGHLIQSQPTFGEPSPFRTVIRSAQTSAAPRRSGLSGTNGGSRTP